MKACKHPKGSRVALFERGRLLVAWCFKCGAFQHHIEELAGTSVMASATFESWVSPKREQERVNA
jgi:hypothetical protein